MLENWRCSILPALLLLVLPVISMAQVGINISVNLAPPELPVYEQPAIPDDGLSMDPRLLGLERRRSGLLLGAGHLGTRSAAGISFGLQDIGAAVAASFYGMRATGVPRSASMVA